MTFNPIRMILNDIEQEPTRAAVQFSVAKDNSPQRIAGCAQVLATMPILPFPPAPRQVAGYSLPPRPRL